MVPDTFGASWVDDAKFDIRRHVVREKLARGKGQSERQALQALVGKLATRSLDPQRPLWQVHLVERYQGGTFGGAEFGGDPSRPPPKRPGATRKPARPAGKKRAGKTAGRRK